MNQSQGQKRKKLEQKLYYFVFACLSILLHGPFLFLGFPKHTKKPRKIVAVRVIRKKPTNTKKKQTKTQKKPTRKRTIPKKVQQKPKTRKKIRRKKPRQRHKNVRKKTRKKKPRKKKARKKKAVKLQKKPTSSLKSAKKKPKPLKPRKTKRDYRFLDLRPRWPMARKGRAPSLGAKSKKSGTPQAWQGNDHFSKMMQRYHYEWRQDFLERSGLTDSFFGSASRALDTCLEVWIYRNMKKYLSKYPAQLVFGITWKAKFAISFSSDGKGSVRMLQAKGLSNMNLAALKVAKKCMARVSIPAHLKGKRLQFLLHTKASAKIHANVLSPLGLYDERNPQTGQIRWRLNYLGKIRIFSTSYFTKPRINPPRK